MNIQQKLDWCILHGVPFNEVISLYDSRYEYAFARYGTRFDFRFIPDVKTPFIQEFQNNQLIAIFRLRRR
jgi:hypothetical protein